MKKDVLRTIKNDMWNVLGNKKYLQADIKVRLAEIEASRKEALKANAEMDVSAEALAWLNQRTNETYDKRRVDCIWNLYEQYHNDQSYYLIYKDGSEVCITAEDILAGEKFPKVSDVVYAQMQSADDDMDTEIGNRDFYSEERLAACDYDYSVEDERKEQYEIAIAFKFDTEWSRQYAAKHPKFVPAVV